MRKIWAKMFIGAAITALVAFGADNSLGTWKLNVEKSKLSPGPGPKGHLTMTREAADGGVKVTTQGERPDGTAINSSYTLKYDGSESAVTGATTYDTISMKPVDANTWTATSKKTDGKYNVEHRCALSKDGKTLTITSKGTDAEGKPMNNTQVYDKQERISKKATAARQTVQTGAETVFDFVSMVSIVPLHVVHNKPTQRT